MKVSLAQAAFLAVIAAGSVVDAAPLPAVHVELSALQDGVDHGGQLQARTGLPELPGTQSFLELLMHDHAIDKSMLTDEASNRLSDRVASPESMNMQLDLTPAEAPLHLQVPPVTSARSASRSKPSTVRRGSSVTDRRVSAGKVVSSQPRHSDGRLNAAVNGVSRETALSMSLNAFNEYTRALRAPVEQESLAVRQEIERRIKDLISERMRRPKATPEGSAGRPRKEEASDKAATDMNRVDYKNHMRLLRRRRDSPLTSPQERKELDDRITKLETERLARAQRKKPYPQVMGQSPPAFDDSAPLFTPSRGSAPRKDFSEDEWEQLSEKQLNAYIRTVYKRYVTAVAGKDGNESKASAKLLWKLRDYRKERQQHNGSLKQLLKELEADQDFMDRVRS